jgi:hypothetical protein
MMDRNKSKMEYGAGQFECRFLYQKLELNMKIIGPLDIGEKRSRLSIKGQSALSL